MIDGGMSVVDRCLSQNEAVPVKRLQFARPIFGEEIVGSLVDVEYPDGSGRYVCKVTEYLPDYCWHKIESVVCAPDRSLDMLKGRLEESFTDEVDLNAFWRDRRIQFVGEDDDSYSNCAVCKWQAAPIKSCLICSDCAARVHTRCASSLQSKRRYSFGADDEPNLQSASTGWVCGQCRSESNSSYGSPTQSPAEALPSLKRLRLTSPVEPVRKRSRTTSFGSFVDPVLTAVPLTRQVSISPLTLAPAHLGASSDNPPQPAKHSAPLVGFSEEVMSELCAEFFTQVQSAGCMRRFKFITGPEFLYRVCGGNLNHAVTALQHSATGGVLTWYHGEGESENLKLLKRGLLAEEVTDSVQLIVAVLEVSPCNQPKPALHSKPPTVASCCHLTFGFILLGSANQSLLPMGSKAITTDSSVLFGQVLVYAVRSSHVRSLEEMYAVLTERAWSHWSILDTSDGQLIDYCAEQIQESHDVVDYQVASLSPDQAHNQSPTIIHRSVLDSIYLLQGVHTRAASSPSIKTVSRSGFDPKRFLLVHRGQPVDSLSREYVPAPSRLVFGFGLALLQRLGYRAVLLELALPIAGSILRSGQGRGVEKVLCQSSVRRCKMGNRLLDFTESLVASELVDTAASTPTGISAGTSLSDQMVSDKPPLMSPSWSPSKGSLCLEPTCNAAAYKTYRAFGLGEHVAFNRLGVNQHPEYKYPVLGCVLAVEGSSSSGGLSSRDIRDLSVRKRPHLQGISSWVDSLKAELSTKSLLNQYRVFQELVNRSLPLTEVEGAFQKELGLFEKVLDIVNPNKLGIHINDPSLSKKHSRDSVGSSMSSASAVSTNESSHVLDRRSRKPGGVVSRLKQRKPSNQSEPVVVSPNGTRQQPASQLRSCASSLWNAVFGYQEESAGSVRRSVRISNERR